jgi:hypothetical protein
MAKLALDAVRNHLRDRKRAEAPRELIDQQNSKHELDRRLDQALEETFPASDPVSIVIAS